MENKIINTGEYLLIVDDNSIIASKGQFVLETHNYICPNTISEISGDWDCNRNGYKDKIITAHLPLNSSPKLEGVPILPDLSDEQKIPVGFKYETKWIGFDGDVEVPKTLTMDGNRLLIGEYIYLNCDKKIV